MLDHPGIGYVLGTHLRDPQHFVGPKKSEKVARRSAVCGKRTGRAGDGEAAGDDQHRQVGRSFDDQARIEAAIAGTGGTSA